MLLCAVRGAADAACKTGHCVRGESRCSVQDHRHDEIDDTTARMHALLYELCSNGKGLLESRMFRKRAWTLRVTSAHRAIDACIR